MYYRPEANFVEAEKESYKTDIINNNYDVVLEDVIISDVNTEKGYIRVRKDDQYKYYNFKFEEKKSQDILTANTLFLVKKDGKYGYQNKSGALVVDCIYDDAREQNASGFSAIKKDGKWGSIDQYGNVVIEPEYILKNEDNVDFIARWHVCADKNANYYNYFAYLIFKFLF